MAISRREWLGLSAVGAVAAAAGALVGPILLQTGSGAAELMRAGFTDLAGRPRKLTEWRDRALLCNFWATWCEPCREEIPLLGDRRERYAARGLEVLGIAVDTVVNVAKFVEKTPISYPILLGGFDTLDLMRKLGNKTGGLPFTVILDRSGVITYSRLGALKERELDSQLAAIL